ncbi:MAG: rfaQ 3 [Firmicutes bacterium]|nr:rfaQ 3 [Bacillota bacterium]
MLLFGVCLMEIDSAEIKKVLVINLAFIGDVVLSTPVIRALKEAYPSATVDMLTVPVAAPIARLNPYVDTVLEYDKRGKHKKFGDLLKLAIFLRKRHYDLAITANFAPRGAMLAWGSGIRHRVGYDAQHAGVFLTRTSSAKRPVKRHEAENHLDVLKPLGISTADTSLVLEVDPRDVFSMRDKVIWDRSKKLVLICPCGSYSKKSWTVDGYAALITALGPQQECFLIGSKAEAPQLAAINEAAGNVAGILAGTLTLGELAALIDEAAVLVTVDTGPMHIANALKTPVVALFGPTDPKGWGPRGERDIVISKNVECSPCWGKGECSFNRCLAEIPADEVVVATKKILEE